MASQPTAGHAAWRRRAVPFAAVLLACCVLGALVRLGLGLHASPAHLGSDTPFFRNAASVLVDEGRYTVQTAEGAVDTAAHPPAFVVLLAAGDLVGLDTVGGQRVLLALVGAAAVGFTGLAGKRLGGSAVGIVAALIAAIHPLWTQPGVIIMSEALQLTAVAAAVWVVLRLVDEPTVPNALVAGAVLAVAMLTRSEAMVIWLLVAPLVVLAPRLSWRRRGALAAALCLGTVALVGPWLARNQAVMGSVTMSTNGGITLAGSNCEQTYGGPNLGGFALYCGLAMSAVIQWAEPPDGGETWDPVDLDAELRDSAIRYMREDKTQTAKVVGARVLRTWTPFRRDSQLHLDMAEGRMPTWQRAGRLFHVVLLVPAAAGAILAFRRSRRRAAVVAAFALAVTITVALVYGSTRMRVSAEPTIALFAAMGLVGAFRAVRRRRSGDAATPAPAATA